MVIFFPFTSSTFWGSNRSLLISSNCILWYSSRRNLESPRCGFWLHGALIYAVSVLYRCDEVADTVSVPSKSSPSLREPDQLDTLCLDVMKFVLVAASHGFSIYATATVSCLPHSDDLMRLGGEVRSGCEFSCFWARRGLETSPDFGVGGFNLPPSIDHNHPHVPFRLNGRVGLFHLM